jgi:hypothetical protein
VSLTQILAQPDADFECMGVLMEHTQDVKCVAWHPTEEVNRFFPPSLQRSDASPRSIDSSVCLVRRYNQTLPRRPKRGLVLFFHARRPLINRMVSCMGTKRPIPRICIGRLYNPDLEAYHGTRMGMRTCIRGPRPDGVFGDVGDRKTRHDTNWGRVSWVDGFDRGRWQT